MMTESVRQGRSPGTGTRFIWVAVAGFVIGAYAGGLSLNVRWYLSGYPYGALRHSGVDGVIQRAIDGGLAMAAGGILGARLSWILLAELTALRAHERSARQGLSRWDLALLIPFTLLLYLVYAANWG
jgi:hypothetical protein